jgi:hypothetical protein
VPPNFRICTNEFSSFEQILFRLRLYESEWFVSAGSDDFQGNSDNVLRDVVDGFMTDPKIAQWITDLLDQFSPTQTGSKLAAKVSTIGWPRA